MVLVRPMRADEFPDYSQYFITAYGRDLMDNYGHELAVAADLASAELKRCFPDGVVSQAHRLLCIEREGVLVGYLWHSPNVRERCTFIYDFFVFDAQRSQGIGQSALHSLESELAAQGIEQIKLRVAFDNPRALKLYQQIGFAITGYNMAKLINTAH